MDTFGTGVKKKPSAEQGSPTQVTEKQLKTRCWIIEENVLRFLFIPRDWANMSSLTLKISASF